MDSWPFTSSFVLYSWILIPCVYFILIHARKIFKTCLPQTSLFLLVLQSAASYIPVCITQDLVFQSTNGGHPHAWGVYFVEYIFVYLLIGLFYKQRVSIQNTLLSIIFYIFYFLTNLVFVFLNPWAYKLYPMVNYW